MRSMVEGQGGWADRLRHRPSTTPLRVAVPLPVPGRISLTIFLLSQTMA